MKPHQAVLLLIFSSLLFGCNGPHPSPVDVEESIVLDEPIEVIPIQLTFTELENAYLQNRKLGHSDSLGSLYPKVQNYLRVLEDGINPFDAFVIADSNGQVKPEISMLQSDTMKLNAFLREIGKAYAKQTSKSHQ